MILHMLLRPRMVSEHVMKCSPTQHNTEHHHYNNFPAGKNTINSSLQVVCPPRAAARLYGLVASINRAGCLASWQGRRYILCLYCTQRRRACLSIRWQKIAFEKRKSFYCCWHPRMAAYLSSSAVASKLSLMRSRVQRRAQLKENKENVL